MMMINYYYSLVLLFVYIFIIFTIFGNNNWFEINVNSRSRCLPTQLGSTD